MTTQQKEFLRLAVLEKMKYSDISKAMNVEIIELRVWWQELKNDRELLSSMRGIWKRKCGKASFDEFKIWFDAIERKCHYCGVREDEIKMLIKKGLITTKRLPTRGRKLEIERISPNEPYDNINNLTLCCYWCNNAKTDEFTAEEFQSIGQAIGTIWNKRLAVAHFRNDV